MTPPKREGVAALIGHTPLVELGRTNAARARGVRLFAKLESRNPGGSVKDRAALYMVEDGERRRELPDKALIDATSGNTGISYAMLGAAKGFRVTLVMPANASEERKQILRAFGAELVLTDPTEGQDGAIARVREIVRAEPQRWFYPDQYSNPENARAHAETTGPEIWRQTEGKVTHFIAGLGTSGTAMGTTRFLRESAPAVKCYGIQPAGPFHGLEGLKHMPTSIVPKLYDEKALDGVLTVETERAYDLTRRLAREEGLFCGTSSGAALAGALDLAAGLPAGSVVVTVFPDGGEKYLSTPLWTNPSPRI